MNIFEKSSRVKLRFKTAFGLITTEDLWDLSLPILDVLAKSLNKEIKLAEEESFIKTKTNASATVDLAFEIVKYVITIKLEEAEVKKNAAAKKAKNAQIMDFIVQKENVAMSEKSIDELKAMLED